MFILKVYRFKIHIMTLLTSLVAPTSLTMRAPETVAVGKEFEFNCSSTGAQPASVYEYSKLIKYVLLRFCPLICTVTIIWTWFCLNAQCFVDNYNNCLLKIHLASTTSSIIYHYCHQYCLCCCLKFCENFL